MEAHTPYLHFSSEVRIELRVEGNTFDVAAAGPRNLILRNPVELPPCDADVVMFIDGKGFIVPIHLRNGAVPFDRQVAFTRRGSMQPLS